MPNINVPKPYIWKEFKLETEFLQGDKKVRLQLRPMLKKDRMKGVMLLAKALPKRPELQEAKIDKAALMEDVPSADEIMKVLEANIDVVRDCVVGWDLMQDDKPLECNDDNKQLYLDALLWEDVVEEESPEGEKQESYELPILASYVLGIVSDLRNFVKN